MPLTMKCTQNYPIFKNHTETLDADLSDKDNLIVVANEDILITPTVEGIEIIEFELAMTSRIATIL